MSSGSFYTRRAKFGGMDAPLISEMQSMSEENRRLKRMYAEMSIQIRPARAMNVCSR